MPIRYHLDEQVPTAIASGLRRHGIDVTTSRDMALLGRDDDDQLAFAISEQRVLVTHDDDFTKIHARGIPHFGICYCHLKKYSLGELLRMLLIVVECFSEEEAKNRLEYL